MPGTPTDIEYPPESFPAKWPGKCSGCGEPFDAGEIIRMIDGKPVVDECGDPGVQLTPKPTKPACRSCFQVPAANGTCGCDV